MNIIFQPNKFIQKIEETTRQREQQKMYSGKIQKNATHQNSSEVV